MAKRNPRNRTQPGPPVLAAGDLKVQRAVLAFVLDQHPNHFTLVELGREITGNSTEPDETDAFAHSVLDLVVAGLLECEGAYVVPTGAAIWFERLEAH